MPVPFGISIGDFIALIDVTVTIVNALKDSTGSAKEYQDVIRELESLSLALINVRDIKTDRTELKAALTSVVSNCGRTVQDFLNKIRRFEVSLGTPGCSRRKFKDGLRKIQWALYSKDDIRSFQIELYSHTASLNILLAKVNYIMNNAAQQDHQRALNDHSQALVRIESKLDQRRASSIAMQAMIVSAITQCWSQFRSLVALILFSNLRIFSCVVEGSRIPPQVKFEDPVYFEDAHGRSMPVHMAWIKSWENFETMLKMAFSDVPGLSLIERGQYVLTDAYSKMDLHRTRPIQTAFRPGRNINMSMKFLLNRGAQNCPKCDFGMVEAKEKENCCMNCGLFYSRFKTSPTISEPTPEPDMTFGVVALSFEELRFANSQESDQSRGSHNVDHISDFARVRIFEVTDVSFTSRSQEGARSVRYCCDWPECRKTFTRASDFRRHHKTIHQAIKQYWCIISGCIYSESFDGKKHPFKRKDKLMSHMKNIHFIVASSSASFDTSNTVNRLIKTHGLPNTNEFPDTNMFS